MYTHMREGDYFKELLWIIKDDPKATWILKFESQCPVIFANLFKIRKEINDISLKIGVFP